MQHYYNRVELVGRLHGEINTVTNPHGDTFFNGTLAVQRTSGVVDYLPISIPSELVDGTPAEDMCTKLQDRHLRLRGQVRSYNKEEQGKSRHYTTVLVREISDADKPDDDNYVELQGVICRPPVYRETPLGREICDFMIAINLGGKRGAYIPCICWRRTARDISTLDVGTTVCMRGRFQSREYQKVLENGNVDTRKTCEVSCKHVDVVKAVEE